MSFATTISWRSVWWSVLLAVWLTAQFSPAAGAGALLAGVLAWNGRGGCWLRAGRRWSVVWRWLLWLVALGIIIWGTRPSALAAITSADMATVLRLHQATLGGGLTLTFLLVLQGLPRWVWLRWVEAFLFLVVLSAVLEAHREGHLQRPSWLSDILVEHDLPLLAVLRYAGIAAALLTGIYFAVFARGSHGRRSRWLGVAFFATTMAFGLALSSLVAPPKVQLPVTVLPPPPQEDEPPPPPPPRNVALVLFQDWFRLPSSLDGCYFTVDQLEHDAGRMVSPQSRTVTSEVHLLVEDAGLPAFVGSVLKEPLQARGPFVSSFKFVSVLLDPEVFSYSVHEDSLGDPGWTAEERRTLLQCDLDADARALTGKTSGDALSAGYKVAAVMEWLQRHVALSEQSAQKRGDLTPSDLIRTKVGSRAQMAQTAAQMIRSLGIPARVREGYFYPPGPEFRKEVLLTELHKRSWPEVYLKGQGWVPLPLQPDRVLDEPAPPPQADMEELLAQLSRQEKPKAPQDANRATPVVRSWALLPAWGAVMLGAVFLCHPPVLMAYSRRRSEDCFLYQILMLRMTGFSRRFGEDWPAFFHRVSRHSRGAGENLTFAMSLLRLPDVGVGWWRATCTCYRMWFSVPALIVGGRRLAPRAARTPMDTNEIL